MIENLRKNFENFLTIFLKSLFFTMNFIMRNNKTKNTIIKIIKQKIFNMVSQLLEKKIIFKLQIKLSPLENKKYVKEPMNMDIIDNKIIVNL